MKKKTANLITAGLIVALFVVLYVLEQVMDPASMLFVVLKKGAIYALVAVSMNLLNGFTGLFSLGQAGFMLIGGYTYAIFSLTNEARETVYQYFDCAIGITLGVVPALSALVRLFTPDGSKVLIQTPVYSEFYDVTEAWNRTVVENQLVEKDGKWTIDWADFEAKLPQVSMFLLCSPHNPLGIVWTREELTRMAGLCRKHNVFLVSDEIHSDLVFHGKKHIPTASLSPETAAQVITCISGTKTFNLAGLIGSYHIIYNPYLRDRVRKQAELSHYNSMNVLSMHALIGAYQPEGHEWVDELRHVLTENVEYAYSYILDHFSGVELAKPEGTYMLYLDCEKFCQEHDMSMDELIRAGIRVGVIWQDGRPFHRPYAIRLNLALPHSQVAEAMARLDKYVFNK